MANHSVDTIFETWRAIRENARGMLEEGAFYVAAPPHNWRQTTAPITKPGPPQPIPPSILFRVAVRAGTRVVEGDGVLVESW